MKDLTDYFRILDRVNNNPSPENPNKEPKREIKDYSKTPKSRKNTRKNRTPRGKSKLSPKLSPSEGFNLLFSSPKTPKPTTSTSNSLTPTSKNKLSPKLLFSSPKTPKSITNTRKSKTPTRKHKQSPKLSPLEGFNLLFSSIAKQSPQKVGNNSKMEVETPECQDGEDSLNDSTEQKKNAFQVLMMSRKKVIGSNSPGKEQTTSEEVEAISPPKLSARKRLLQSWSDSIKAKKRKLNDEEIDKCIKVKLEARKERFKTLLHVDSDTGNETNNVPKTKRKKKQSIIKGDTEKTIPNKTPTKKLPETSEEIAKENLEISASRHNKSLSSGDDFEIKADAVINTPKSSSDRRAKRLSSTPKCSWKMKIKLLDKDTDDNEPNKEKKNIENDIIIQEENDGEKITKVTQSETKTNKTNKKMIETIQCKINITKVNKELTETIVTNTNKPKTDDDVVIIDNTNDGKRVLRSRNTLNKNKNVDYTYSSDESGDEVKQKKSKKNIKVAPVFAKALPKQKIDPEVLEARRKFLMSDMPDVLRKRIEKQSSNDHQIQIEVDVFPKVSHVYQQETENPLWNLPNPNLKIKDEISFICEPNELLCKSLIDKREIKQSTYYKDSKAIKNTKPIIKEMKIQYPNYPVYKAYRLLREKSGSKTEPVQTKSTPKRGKKRKVSTEKAENTLGTLDVQNQPQFQTWVEKYKPKSSEDFFSNIQAVLSVKRWLEKWREVLNSGKKKRKHTLSDSDSEFMSSDADSVYDRSLATTVVLAGPCGSGKSSSVYAICNELGLNVLELNASSRRTGKQVLQELQEATQSHQVRKNKSPLSSFTKKNENEKPRSKKMCVLLIEDIDLVFEQDEGFISAISQISANSKRPLILTTTNENSPYVQKFTNDFKLIRFNSSSAQRLGVWLQILCLVEGIYVDLSSIYEFLEYNRGDIRKTLLELQYWIQTGGQINKSKSLVDPLYEIDKENSSIRISDDTPNISLKECDEKFENYRVHTNILADFEIFQLEKYYNIPPKIDLKTLWWNIPKFLTPPQPKHITNSPSKKRLKKRLKMVSDMYDSVASFDILYSKMGYKNDDPVCRKIWHSKLQDSLELEENSEGLCFNQDLLELNHYLTDGHLDSCKKKFIYELHDNERFCNMAVPKLSDERQIDNNHRYEEELLFPVPFHNSLDRKSVVLDYLPSLRTIARSENERAKNNVKRHNRFNHYLHHLNINCDAPILEFAIGTFSKS